MAPHLRFTALLLIILLGSAALGRERIAQRLLVKSEWVTLEENSAVHFLRARNRFNGRIIKPLPKVQDSLRRRFYVEEQEVAFGEPVLIEYRVDGENWNETIGGNYRGSGRDEGSGGRGPRDEPAESPDLTALAGGGLGDPSQTKISGNLPLK